VNALRQYQADAVAGVFAQWDKVQATMGVAATGAGKTQIFCEIVRRRQPGKCIILAHRTELVDQAVKRLKRFGIEASVEQGEKEAQASLWNSSPVIVATPQTLYSNKFARLKKFRPEDFSTLICDEAHHYAGAPSFEAVVKHFKSNPALKLLGVTATPDRADNQAMARVFDSVAFDIEITDLIKLGYLVNVDQRMVKIETLDFSKCRVAMGDLNSGDVIQIMETERTLLGMADAIVKTVGDRRTVVFCAGVKQAERMAEIFNRHREHSAACVFGHTPDDERKETLRKFGAGELQICVNVGVLTEGYDNPGIEAVVMARATLSRSLYAQMAGRGLRALTGVVESIMVDDASLRCRAIATSAKPSLLLLDFVGNSGRHSLITSADILGGKISEQARVIARKKIEKNGSGDMLDELALAEKELKEREEARKRRGLKPDATYTLTYVDPFDAFTKRAEKWKGYVQKFPLSEKQRQVLAKNGYNPDDYTPAEGQAIITKLFQIKPWQVQRLVRAGYPSEEVASLSTWEAYKLIDGVNKNGGKRPAAPFVPPPPKAESDPVPEANLGGWR
jgi:superfamily II DNA or RNA helicase